MKYFFFSILLLGAQLAFAQSSMVSGTVRDRQGDPLHFAFVQDVQYKYATYTDSIGNFALMANPASALKISCIGYRDTLIKVNNNNAFNIVLNVAVNINGTKINSGIAGTQNDIAHQTFADQVNQGQGTAAPVDMAQGAIFPVFSQKGVTVGSRYLLPKWSHGYVINSKDNLIQNSGFFFNYDKMGGGLLLSKDKNAAIQIDMDLVKSFILYNDANMPYEFENVPAINTTHYVEVLAKGNKYKIYKYLTTKFEKDNYATDGIATTGHDYDEYIDEGDYYIYNMQTGQMQPVTLKKKAIKAAFASEADKVNKFMTDHSDDTIDDTYLSTLGSYMNE